MLPSVLLSGLALVAVGWWLIRQRRRRRRSRLFQEEPAASWIEILRRRVPLYSRLPSDLKRRLHGHVNVFLDEKVFVGCGGQEIDDDIRLTIAGNACLLALRRAPPLYPAFETILVYPDTYLAPEVSYDGLVEVHGETARLGESWHRGPVVLSWADVVRGVEEGGHNVVMHEFAHKLDEENLDMDGLPVLRDRRHYPQWAQVLSREYDAFCQRVDAGSEAVIDSYGAESPAEFFAVITEAFFDKPVLMKQQLPDLYSQLARYYEVDPATWG